MRSSLRSYDQSYLLVQFLTDPTSFTNTTKLEYANAVLAEREAAKHLTPSTEVQRAC